MKCVKRLVALIAIIAMFSTLFSFSTFAAGTPTITISSPDVAVKAGDTVELTLNITNNPGLTGMEMWITFDSQNVVLASKPEGGDIFSYFFAGNKITTSPYKMIINDDNDDYYVEDDGLLATMTFQIAETAEPGDYTIGFGDGLYIWEDNSDISESDFDLVTATITVAGDEPTVPTADDLGLFTDASQNFKVAEKVMTSNGYSIEKALGFVSGIYADAAVVTYGTEITCEGFDKVLDIPAANYYEADENVKGFVAAVTSIRNDNLNKTFTAKAYADVTVGEETVRIYAEEAATAVYGN